jgi:hypothetical protein
MANKPSKTNSYSKRSNLAFYLAILALAISVINAIRIKLLIG